MCSLSMFNTVPEQGCRRSISSGVATSYPSYFVRELEMARTNSRQTSFYVSIVHFTFYSRDRICASILRYSASPLLRSRHSVTIWLQLRWRIAHCIHAKRLIYHAFFVTSMPHFRSNVGCSFVFPFGAPGMTDFVHGNSFVFEKLQDH